MYSRTKLNLRKYEACGEKIAYSIFGLRICTKMQMKVTKKSARAKTTTSLQIQNEYCKSVESQWYIFYYEN